MRETFRFGLILMLVGVVSSTALVGVRFFTQGPIEAQRVREEKEALGEVLPGADTFTALREGEELLYYRGYAASFPEKIVGYAFLATGVGYSSTIVTIVGITPGGKITGIKILSQQETPGLGANLEEIKTTRTLYRAIKELFQKEKTSSVEKNLKPWFQAQFAGKEISALAVVKEKTEEKIQALTGATISSEAVTDSVAFRAEEVLALIKEKEGKEK